jgi:hypothetical protein
MAAIKLFDQTMTRSRSLLDLHKKLPPEQIALLSNQDDLLRAAVALAVAGMDAYFTDRFAESLVPFLKRRGATQGVVKILHDAGLNTQAALEMLTMQRPYRRIRTLIESHLSNYTTQRQEVIDALFLVYGVKDLCKNAQGIARRATLLRRVDVTVLRRHSIVHEGDYNAHGKLRALSNRYATGYVKDIDLLVRSCEAILSKALRT